MKTTDLEFEYNERADGYIYVNEDKLETEVKELLRSGKDVEALRMNEEISREAYLCLTKKREAVLKWYHFKEESEILEIGAGYGELTEYLCQRISCNKPEWQSKFPYGWQRILIMSARSVFLS